MGARAFSAQFGAIRRNSLSLLVASAGERNYHIFYHMLAGASLDEKKQYKLLSSTSAYTYTKGTSFADGIDDAVEWTSVRHKLEVLGFTESDQQQMFRLFSAVLAIGNITFKPGAAADTHQVDGKDALALAAELLQVETASHMPCTRPHTPEPTLDPRSCRWRRRRSRPSSRRR